MYQFIKTKIIVLNLADLGALNSDPRARETADIIGEIQKLIKKNKNHKDIRVENLDTLLNKIFEKLSMLTNIDDLDEINEELKKISMTEDYVVPATNLSESRVLDNHTTRATRKAGDVVTCGKTGGWTSKDSSLVLEFDDGQPEGAVVLIKDSVKGRRNDAKALIDFAPVVTPGYTVSTAEDEVGLTKVKHGEKTRVALMPEASTVAYPASGKTKDIKIEIEADTLEAPVTKGDAAGTYRVYANDKLVAERKLLAAEDVKTGWLPSYLYISNIETVCMIIVILIVLLMGFATGRGRRRGR
jgi:SHS2 domain-containing protein